MLMDGVVRPSGAVHVGLRCGMVGPPCAGAAPKAQRLKRRACANRPVKFLSAEITGHLQGAPAGGSPHCVMCCSQARECWCPLPPPHTAAAAALPVHVNGQQRSGTAFSSAPTPALGTRACLSLLQLDLKWSAWFVVAVRAPWCDKYPLQYSPRAASGSRCQFLPSAPLSDPDYSPLQCRAGGQLGTPAWWFLVKAVRAAPQLPLLSVVA